MFVAKSEYLKKIKKLADSLKELKLNVYIWGDVGVGKSFLARYILPNGIVNPPYSTPEVILDELKDDEYLEFKNSVVVAVGKKKIKSDFFDIDIELKPLKEHPEDIDEFIKFFSVQAKDELKIYKDIELLDVDISENLNSLKRDVYRAFFDISSKDDLFKSIEKFYFNNPDILYDEEIKNFERALFRAMKRVYKSKLKISEKIKINRVTLTKKMKGLNV